MNHDNPFNRCDLAPGKAAVMLNSGLATRSGFEDIESAERYAASIDPSHGKVTVVLLQPVPTCLRTGKLCRTPDLCTQNDYCMEPRK